MVGSRQMRSLIKKERDDLQEKIRAAKESQMNADSLEENVLNNQFEQMESNNLHEIVQIFKSAMDDMRTELFVLTEAVESQTAYIKHLLKRDHVKFEAPRSTFPLRSESDLEQINLEITPDNKQIYVNNMTNLLSHDSLSKSIKKLIVEKIIVDHNIAGIGNKKSLKTYESFFSALLEAIQLTDATQPAETLLRGAMLRVKNNYSKMKNKIRKTRINNGE